MQSAAHKSGFYDDGELDVKTLSDIEGHATWVRSIIAAQVGYGDKDSLHKPPGGRFQDLGP
jgi:hypothetical protein